MLVLVQRRLSAYLDGDLMSALKFPEKLQTLDDEIESEDSSDWSSKPINFHSVKEDDWRDSIQRMVMEDDYPDSCQADKKFLGGKQVHRAIEFFHSMMIFSLPDPFELEEKVANITGYLNGNLEQEAWEHAMVQLIQVLMKEVSHPGVNYLVHIGNIYRRLFSVALEDIKSGGKDSASFKQLPDAVERYLAAEFDTMLWALMSKTAENMHTALEPMYSTIDPHLPTFNPKTFADEKAASYYVKKSRYGERVCTSSISIRGRRRELESLGGSSHDGGDFGIYRSQSIS
jgi:hypothetical protein